MEIKVLTGNIVQQSSDFAAVVVLEDAALPVEVANLLEPDDFRGRSGQAILLYPHGALSPRRLLLVGLGKAEKLTRELVRRAAATALQSARELQVAEMTIGAAGGTRGYRCGRALAGGVPCTVLTVT